MPSEMETQVLHRLAWTAARGICGRIGLDPFPLHQRKKSTRRFLSPTQPDAGQKVESNSLTTRMSSTFTMDAPQQLTITIQR
jgi:hypothetical protein